MSKLIEHLRALHEAATPGEWTTHKRSWVDGGLTLTTRAVGPFHEECNFPSDEPRGEQADADVAFVKTLRNALPALLARLEAAEAALAEWGGPPQWHEAVEDECAAWDSWEEAVEASEALVPGDDSK